MGLYTKIVCRNWINLDNQCFTIDVESNVTVAFTGDDRNFTTSVAVEDFSTKYFFYDRSVLRQ